MNFFKNYKEAIIVLGFVAICFLIGFISSRTNQDKQTPISNEEQLSNNNKQKLNQHDIDTPKPKIQITNDKESNQPSNDKREIDTPKPKIQITKEKYDKIKFYILSENENKVLTLNDLSQEEKNEIEKDRKLQKQRLEFRKKDKKEIDEHQKICDELKSNRDSVINQIPPLKEQLKQKEKEKIEKDKEINKLRLKEQNKRTELQKQGKTTYKNNELTQIDQAINKLQDEKLELVGQIEDIELQIDKLKSKQTMFEGMLSDAVKMRDALQRGYDKNLLYYTQSALSSLNSLYEINPNEG
ncbi:MAG: hypothetical protein WJU30_00094 [Candidatus Phytoplasma pruni]